MFSICPHVGVKCREKVIAPLKDFLCRCLLVSIKEGFERCTMCLISEIYFDFEPYVGELSGVFRIINLFHTTTMFYSPCDLFWNAVKVIWMWHNWTQMFLINSQNILLNLSGIIVLNLNWGKWNMRWFKCCSGFFCDLPKEPAMLVRSRRSQSCMWCHWLSYC